MLRALPGSPFDSERLLPKSIIQRLEHKYGLDKKPSEQLYTYIKNLLSKGDLGPSLKYPNRDVKDILFQALPVSLTIGLLAFLVSTFVGIGLGIFAATYPQSLFAKFTNFFSTFSMSMPSFVFAGLLISFFALKLSWLPVALYEGPKYIILPVITLSLAPTAYITRISKASMQENLNKKHIQTALAKGLSLGQVIFKHGFFNSLSSIMTVLGPIFAILITGSFVVEYIFALPGMGKYFVTGFINRDYFLVSGVIVIFSLILLLVNTVSDFVVYLMSPKEIYNV